MCVSFEDAIAQARDCPCATICQSKRERKSERMPPRKTADCTRNETPLYDNIIRHDYSSLDIAGDAIAYNALFYLSSFFSSPPIVLGDRRKIDSCARETRLFIFQRNRIVMQKGGRVPLFWLAFFNVSSDVSALMRNELRLAERGQTLVHREISDNFFFIGNLDV